MGRIVLHHASDGGHLLLGEGILIQVPRTDRGETLAQHICKANDNVQRCTYLVRHVLYELCLLSDSHLCQLCGAHQFLISLLRLLDSPTNAAYMVIQ